MKAKRSKAYKKAMRTYQMTFGFREPYQVLLDAEMVKTTYKYKMDLLASLERTLHGKIKPMITQCCMRHLYASDPPAPDCITFAKTFDRRYCGHHELPEPLSTEQCLLSQINVVDKKSGQRTGNTHRYVIAVQDEELRLVAKTIPGVPIIFLYRGVMCMEKVADVSLQVKEREEMQKMLTGLKDMDKSKVLGKRKREANEDLAEADGQENKDSKKEKEKSKGKRKRGPKGPNPLSVKKKKSKPQTSVVRKAALPEKLPASSVDQAPRKKRKRKHAPSKIEQGPLPKE